MPSNEIVTKYMKNKTVGDSHAKQINAISLNHLIFDFWGLFFLLVKFKMKRLIIVVEIVSS